MDNGEVIVGLNETWTFAGATVFEWGSGFLVFIMASELVDKPGRCMPFLLSVLLISTLSLAAARRSFPDEDAGLRNWLMVMFGMTPLFLPKCASQQPYWSGAPARELPKGSHFDYLKLGDLFEKEDEAPTDEYENLGLSGELNYRSHQMKVANE